MKVTFSSTHSAFSVKAPAGTLVSLTGTPAEAVDGVYTIGDEGCINIDEQMLTKDIYLSISGEDYTVAAGARIAYPAEGVEVRAGSSVLPFKIGGKGGGGGSGGGCTYRGTTTTAISNGSTTNPITIDGESYTAVFGDVVVYGYTEFVFDGTTWSEFGRPFDTVPTQGSANAVTSDGIYTSLSGKQSIMQYAVMPTVTQDMVGRVAQYIGETTASHTHGYFYTATSDGWMNTPAAGKTYYSETVLWENTSHSATPIDTTISLYDSFKNYDAVAGIIEYNTDNRYTSCNIIPTSQLASNIIWTNNFDIGSTDNSFVSIAIIGDTSIKIAGVAAQYTSHLQKFIGIKYNDQIAHDYIIGLTSDFDALTNTRTGDAVGISDPNAFLRFATYAKIRKCNMADDGTINAYYGDPTYAEDGSNGQAMLEVPKFYYKMTPITTEAIDTGIGYHVKKASREISDRPRAGFKVFPWFVDSNGNEVERQYIGVYEACAYDNSASAYLAEDEQVVDFTADKLSSIAGVKPISGISQNLTRANAEALAQNRGSHWHAMGIDAASAMQWLCVIACGSYDSQTAIGAGVTGISDVSGANCASYTGSTASLGTLCGRATSTLDYTKTVQTDENKTAVSLFGIENMWGNIFKFCDGINIWGDSHMGGGQPYICTDGIYTESTKTDNYEAAGFTLPNVNSQYIKYLGYGGADYDWTMLGSETVSAISESLIRDKNFVTTDLSAFNVSLLGGIWNNGSTAGSFYVNASAAVGYRGRNISARLCYDTRTQNTRSLAKRNEEVKELKPEEVVER